MNSTHIEEVVEGEGGGAASSEDNSFLSASILLCHSTLPCKKILNSSDSHGGRIVKNYDEMI